MISSTPVYPDFGDFLNEFIMRHLIEGFREVSVEGHNFGVWVAVQRFMYFSEKRQHVRKNGSVLHKPVLMFGNIEGEVVVESCIDEFFKDFAFDVQ